MTWIKHAAEHSEKIWNYTDIGCVMVNNDMSIDEINQYCATTLEYTTLELRGKHVDDITDFPDRGIGVAEIQRVKTGELPYFEQIKTYLSKTGKKIKSHTRSFPVFELDDHGRKIPDEQTGFWKIHHFFSVIIFHINGTADLAKLNILETEMRSMKKIIEALVGRNTVNQFELAGSTKKVNVGDVGGNFQSDVGGNASNYSSKIPPIIWILIVAGAAIIAVLIYLVLR